jgi:hypothetical protein
MKKHDILKKIGLGLAISALAAYQASAIVAYNTPTGVTAAGLQTDGPYILGNEFNVNSAISVTAIGAFNYSGTGFSSPVQVAIYRLITGTWTQVGGTAATFSGSYSPSSYVGGNVFTTLGSSVTLGLGTYAIVAANYGTVANPDWNSSLDPGAAANQRPIFQNGGGAISMPSGLETAFYSSGSSLGGSLSGLTTGNWGSPNPAFGAGTFQFNLTAVPEADTFAIAAVSMLGLVFIGRNLVPRRSY